MVQLDTFSCQNIDHLNEALSGTELENYQLSKGEFSGNISHIDLGKTILDTGTYSKEILAKGTFPKEKITFATILEAGDGKSLLRSCELKKDTLLCLSENSEMSYVAAANSRWSTFQVTREELEILNFDIKAFEDTTLKQSFDQAKNSSREIYSIINELHRLNQDELNLLNNDIVYDRVLSAYLKGFQQSECLVKLDKKISKNIAWQVYDYINSHPNDTVTMKEFCSITQRSERTIQRSFKANYNITLSDFMKKHRLHQVRRAINQPHGFTTLIEAALHYGFSHLSRFSQEYKNLFGESAVTTLKKNRIGL